jgi:hypothetical protein
MKKINWKRVVLGDSISGVVLMVLAAVVTAIFGGQGTDQAILKAFKPSPISSRALFFVVFVFLFLGVLMTALYAAIRPRFGSGVKTGAIAGFSVWITGVTLSGVGFAVKSLVMGEDYPLPFGPLLPCVCLGMMIASTLAGTSIYKEQRD